MNSNKPRQEATIPIGGLDTSTPDELAPNGTCATLHNLRYVDNAWHGVGPLTPLAEIPFGSTTKGSTTTTSFVKILYKHPASPDNKYIAFIKNKVTTKQGGGGSSRMELVGYAEVDITAQRPNPDGTMTTITDTVAMAQQAVLLDGLDANTDYTFTHFGKVLIAQGGGELHYFVHDTDTNKYSPFQVPRPVRMIHRIKARRAPQYDSTLSEDAHFWPVLKDGVLQRATGGQANTWWGEICCFVAYRMKDGTVLSPSALHIICSEETNGFTEELYIQEIGKSSSANERTSYICVIASDAPNTLKQLQDIIPELRIYIPEGIDTSLVDRVALYSTRIHPFLDYEKMSKVTTRYNIVGTTDYSEFYADNDLPSQPFYLVDEVQIGTRNEWIVELGYDKLQSLETQGQEYKPIQVHPFIAGTHYEYNNRMHFGELTSTLFSHVSSVRLLDQYKGNELREMVRIPSIGCSQFSYPIAKDG